MRRFFELLRCNWISAVGANLVTFAFVGLVSGYVLESTGVWSGPYIGLITLAWVGLFVFGLILVPTGFVVFRRSLRERLAATHLKVSTILLWISGLSLLNFVTIGAGATTGVHQMATVEFCGEACHNVMGPEFETYHDSPHAGVACVACHVGPGATWYVKSKLAGARQAYLTLTDSWEAPIPTPVHELRSARDTCGACHWTKHQDDERVRVVHTYTDDEEAVRLTSVLRMNVGGQHSDGSISGIHFHAHPDTRIEYVHTDAKRSEIPWVRVVRSDGTESVYTAEGVDPAAPPEGTLREMDCTDCHNRPAHRFQGVDEALNEALVAGRLDTSLPFVMPASRAALTAEHARADARTTIRASLADYYTGQGVDAPAGEQLDGAADALAAIWLRNVYPERGVGWDQYPSLAGHDGCLRCHDGEHLNEDGDEITFSCEACHAVLAMQEEEPEALELLGLEEDR